MSVCDYGAVAWVEIMFGQRQPPPVLYVALCLAEPGISWDGDVLTSVEPDPLANYIRQPVALPDGWVSTESGSVVNANDLDFPTPVEDWGILEYFALTDDPRSGNLWGYGGLLNPGLNVHAGADVIVAAGGIQTGLANLLPAIVE